MSWYSVRQPSRPSLLISANPATHQTRHQCLDCPSCKNNDCHECGMPIEYHCAMHHPSALSLEQNLGHSDVPRRPKPADIPPRTFLTIHSRSNLSSSKTLKTLDMKWLSVCPGLQPLSTLGGCEHAGCQIESRNRRNSLDIEE
jgi:hypothetical protein